MSNKNQTLWTLEALQEHLKFAIDLEFWTIPFYRTALHALPSGQDSASKSITDVSDQEMFHCQCAWNLAQAFGVTDYNFADRDFSYSGTTIPHLNFALEDPNPAAVPVEIEGTTYDFTDYSAELDTASFDQRINAMCLVEYPDWAKPTWQEMLPIITNYPSIGHFYAAIQSLMTTEAKFVDGTLVMDAIQANTPTQTNLFAGKLPDGFPYTVTETGEAGIDQINAIINAIVEEGEGTSSSSPGVPPEYQYNGDTEAHFNSFLDIKSGGAITQKTMKDTGVTDIMNGLATFLPYVQTMFESGGTNSGDFFNQMYAFDGVISGAFNA